MTKKDFNELAEQLAEQLAIVRREVLEQIPDQDNAKAGKFVWLHCVEAIFRACRVTSANFDPQKFREKCNK